MGVFVGNHRWVTEMFEVYDPAKISMVDLLRWFWESHDPTQGDRQGNDRGTQYRDSDDSRIFLRMTWPWENPRKKPWIFLIDMPRKVDAKVDV